VAGTVAAYATNRLNACHTIFRFGSPLSASFWQAILAFVVGSVVLIAVSLVTQPKPTEELRGLVWGLVRPADRRPVRVLQPDPDRPGNLRILTRQAKRGRDQHRPPDRSRDARIWGVHDLLGAQPPDPARAAGDPRAGIGPDPPRAGDVNERRRLEGYCSVALTVICTPARAREIGQF
jgi:hypothetical protein